MPKKKLPDDIRAYFAKEGAKGGKIGGAKRSASLTPEQRTELAKKAASARWGKPQSAEVRTAKAAKKPAGRAQKPTPEG